MSRMRYRLRQESKSNPMGCPLRTLFNKNIQSQTHRPAIDRFYLILRLYHNLPRVKRVRFFSAYFLPVCLIHPKRNPHYNLHMYKNVNFNPSGRRTTDCVIRALARVFDSDWEAIYDEIAAEGKRVHDMMDANHVWIRWMERHGFKLHSIPNMCPDCYTIREFCRDHPTGTYVLGTGSHAIAVVDGDYYDTFDSGDLVPIFYLRRRTDGL